MGIFSLGTTIITSHLELPIITRTVLYTGVPLNRYFVYGFENHFEKPLFHMAYLHQLALLNLP